MSIKRLKDSMSIISELSDEPNDIDGLSSAELKAKFDAAGTIIKDYLNNSLIPDVEADIVKNVSDLTVQSGNMPAGGTQGQVLVKASSEPFDWGFKTMSEIPAGGLSGHVLTKKSDSDFDTHFAQPLAVEWALLNAFEKAGTYTWTAPDVYGDGKPYSIGAYIIGGGGSGGAASLYTTSAVTYIASATGGASGYGKCPIITVTPGVGYPVVVGKGGVAMQKPAVLANSSRAEGNAGGSTAFAGITVNGGGGGWGATTAVSSGSLRVYAPRAANGGQGSDAIEYDREINYRHMRAVAPAMGRQTYDGIGEYNLVGGISDPESTFNRFTGEYYLAAGGMAYAYESGGVYAAYTQTGYTFKDGKKAGDGAVLPSRSEGYALTAGSATAPGCGGGACAIRNITTGQIATSGAGADGAVYIYVRRQSR